MYQQITSNKRKSIFLVVLFIIFIIALGHLLALASGYGGYSGMIFAAFFSTFYSLISYYSGDKMALWSSGAKEIKKEENPYVYRMVENLCIATGLPVPKVHIIQDSAPNAFATGRDPEHASIALTTGIIDQLENEELEAVIAHELSHIKNYDIRLMTLIIALVGIVSILTDMFIRSFIWGRLGSSDNRQNSSPVLLIIGIVLSILSPIIAMMIQMGVSRKREFLADASASLMTRYPQALASALRKISSHPHPMASASSATSHLFISNPFGKSKKFSLSNFFSTHPPIDDRIEALNKMSE